MSELFILFTNNLLPVFLAAGAGFVLARYLRIPARPFSQAVFYVFSPCLIFTLMTNSSLDGGEVLKVVGITVALAVTMGLLAWMVGRILRFDREILTATIMTSMFKNAGNYGLAVTLFAFGENALSYSSIFFITNSMLSYSAGAFIASLGKTSAKDSLRNLLKVPGLYAAIIGITIMATGWHIPLPVDRAVTLLGDASIPVMLIILGMQLHGVQFRERKIPLATAVMISLLAAPFVALLMNQIFGLQGGARQAVILEASMPAAVMNIVLATEYNLQPSHVTAVVFLTTLLSPLTLTPLIAFLGG